MGAQIHIAANKKRQHEPTIKYGMAKDTKNLLSAFKIEIFGRLSHQHVGRLQRTMNYEDIKMIFMAAAVSFDNDSTCFSYVRQSMVHVRLLFLCAFRSCFKDRWDFFQRFFSLDLFPHHKTKNYDYFLFRLPI